MLVFISLLLCCLFVLIGVYNILFMLSYFLEKLPVESIHLQKLV